MLDCRSRPRADAASAKRERLEPAGDDAGPVALLLMPLPRSGSGWNCIELTGAGCAHADAASAKRERLEQHGPAFCRNQRMLIPPPRSGSGWNELRTGAMQDVLPLIPPPRSGSG